VLIVPSLKKFAADMLLFPKVSSILQPTRTIFAVEEFAALKEGGIDELQIVWPTQRIWDQIAA
jgi:hypothetical protein